VRSRPIKISRASRATTLAFESAPVVAVAPAGRGLPVRAVWLYGALVRSAQMAGGLDYLLRQASQYATERASSESRSARSR